MGFIIKRKYVIVHPKRIKRIKDKVRRLTPRNSGVSIEEMIERLNPVLRGWSNYFKVASSSNLFTRLMSWIRRRLRMKQMKEWKSYKPLHKELRRRGYRGEFLKISMNTWRNSASPLVSMALPNKWFDEKKLYDMARVETNVLYQYYD